MQDKHASSLAPLNEVEDSRSLERALQCCLRRHLDPAGNGGRGLRRRAVVDAVQVKVDVPDRNAALRRTPDRIAPVQRLRVFRAPADVDLDVRVYDRREIDAQNHVVAVWPDKH